MKHRLIDSPAPACGTVGCVAGWVTALKSPVLLANRPLRNSLHNWDGAVRQHGYNVHDFARHTLGLTTWQSGELFSGTAVTGTPGTPEYARQGADHIARFQAEHEEQLKAKLV